MTLLDVTCIKFTEGARESDRAGQDKREDKGGGLGDQTKDGQSGRCLIKL